MKKIEKKKKMTTEIHPEPFNQAEDIAQHTP
jgi:hypothetical protein